MSGKIRIGVLSFAHYHAQFWSEVFRESPLAEFVGIWDEDAARGTAAAAAFGTRFWQELDLLLENCDAVAICSETVHHLRLVEAATKRRCHILCEKPPATTLADCDAIEKLIAKAGVMFMQSFPKRFDPVNRELKRLVAEGRLGTLALVRVRHGHFHGLEEHFHKEWFVDPVLGGGGTLLDEGVHAADFLRWMFGEPEAVTAMVSKATLNLPVEDVGIAIFRYPSGMLAEICTSWSFAAANELDRDLRNQGNGASVRGRPRVARHYAGQLFACLRDRPGSEAVAVLGHCPAFQDRRLPPAERHRVSRRAGPGAASPGVFGRRAARP